MCPTTLGQFHGFCLFSSGTTSRGSDFDSEAARTACLTFLQTQVKDITGHFFSLETLGLQTCVSKGGSEMKVELTQDFLTIFPFSITRGKYSPFSTFQQTQGSGIGVNRCTNMFEQMHAHSHTDTLIQTQREYDIDTEFPHLHILM